MSEYLTFFSGNDQDRPDPLGQEQEKVETLRGNLLSYNAAYKDYWGKRYLLPDKQDVDPRSVDDTPLLKAKEQRLSQLAHIAGDVTSQQWDNLSPFERRVYDVAAARQLALYTASSYSKQPFAAEDLLIKLSMGERISQESEYLLQEIKEDPCCLGHLNLYHFNNEAQSIYGGQIVNNVRDIGTGVFALQRALSQMIPLILPKLLQKIPEAYTINRAAITSYFKDVLAFSRAKILDEVGIELAVNPHVDKPYTDEEWKTEVTKQLNAAGKIAQSLTEKIPSLVVVTMYGPITRRGKQYVMFHPHEGLQLGAFFSNSNEREVNHAIQVTQEAGQQEGISIKAGTSHGGIFGGSFSGWFFCNDQGLSKIERNLQEPGDWLFKKIDLDNLLELILQISFGEALAVNDPKAYQAIIRRLNQLKQTWIDPVYERVSQLHQHFSAGYPYPLESELKYIY